METKKAMKITGLRYFSSLSPNQKNKSLNQIRIIKNGLMELPFGLAIEILKNKPFEVVIKEIDFITNYLEGSKMFLYEKLDCFLPININQIINEK